MNPLNEFIVEKRNKLVIYPGAILYRCQIEEEPDILFRECCDTGKTGCYLTDSLNIASGIAHEKKSLSRRFFIHHYRVVKTLRFYRGKYSFRNISPERYFDESGNLIIDVEVNEDENISHYEYILRIDDDDQNEEELEMFITTNKEKNSLKYIKSEKIYV